MRNFVLGKDLLLLAIADELSLFRVSKDVRDYDILPHHRAESKQRRREFEDISCWQLTQPRTLGTLTASILFITLLLWGLPSDGEKNCSMFMYFQFVLNEPRLDTLDTSVIKDPNIAERRRSGIAFAPLNPHKKKRIMMGPTMANPCNKLQMNCSSSAGCSSERLVLRREEEKWILINQLHL
jgi:hypothetical protein